MAELSVQPVDEDIYQRSPERAWREYAQRLEARLATYERVTEVALKLQIEGFIDGALVSVTLGTFEELADALSALDTERKA